MEALHTAINGVSQELPREAFTSLLAEAGIAYGAINSVAALAGHSGLNRIRVSTTKGTEITMAAPPIRKSIDAGHGLSSPPKLGQHTESVFGEFGDL